MKSSANTGKRLKSPKVDARLYRIQVIDRVAQILDGFTFEHAEMSVSEIASKTGLHRSTAHRILMALEYNDIVRQNQVSEDYYLGMKLFKLGNQAAVDDEEIELGLRCVGAPIRDHSGNMVGAISVAGPSARLKPENIPVLGKTVMKVAFAISHELGYEDAETFGMALAKQQEALFGRIK